MAVVTLTHIGRQPGQSQFGLDNFTESYKTNSIATDVLTDSSVPQKGDAHPDFPFMFVTDRHVTETGSSASALDLVYQGCMNSSGDGPILPFAKTDNDDQVQSATSSLGNGGRFLTSPLTVQFYAPTTNYQWITFGSIGASGTGPDPSLDPTPIQLICGDASLNIASFTAIITAFFNITTVSTIQNQEIVKGQFWLNSEKRTKIYVPWVFSLTPGDYISLANPGSGYSVGNTLTITGSSGTATVSVTSLGVGSSIFGFTTLTNSMSMNEYLLASSGGSGTDATFNNLHVT